MTDKELRRLSRSELLEILFVQQKEIEQLQTELEQARRQLDDRQLRLSEAGDLAAASVAITNLFEEAQRAADIYLENVKRLSGTQDGEAGGPTDEED